MLKAPGHMPTQWPRQTAGVDNVSALVRHDHAPLRGLADFHVVFVPVNLEVRPQTPELQEFAYGPRFLVSLIAHVR